MFNRALVSAALINTRSSVWIVSLQVNIQSSQEPGWQMEDLERRMHDAGDIDTSYISRCVKPFTVHDIFLILIDIFRQIDRGSTESLVEHSRWVIILDRWLYLPRETWRVIISFRSSRVHDVVTHSRALSCFGVLLSKTTWSAVLQRGR